MQKDGKISGEEDFNFFMSILYPADDLRIMDYNRVLRSLNGLSHDDFINSIRTFYDVKPINCYDKNTLEEVKPNKKHSCSLYLKD